MVNDHYLIRHKIKNVNNKFLIFSPNDKIFFKIEKLLLDNGYKWRTFNTNRSLFGTEYRNYPLSKIIIYINFSGHEPKILSLTTEISMDLINNCDIELTDQNIDYWVRTLFNSIPDYSFKSKIIRTL